MAANPDLQAVEFLLVDPNGVMRGKWAPADSLKKAFKEGVNFPMSIHGLDIWGREVAETGIHIETGDRDGYFRAVPGTLSMVPWASRPTAQVLLQGFTPEGEPLLRSGDTALLRLLLWPVDVPCRVVYVVDEPARKGFAYGTLPGHPARGEESFIVEHRPDDSVWLTIRAFSRPSGWLYWLGYPISRLTQAIITRRYERALTGPIADAR